jgi:hypothetical protein
MVSPSGVRGRIVREKCRPNEGFPYEKRPRSSAPAEVNRSRHIDDIIAENHGVRRFRCNATVMCEGNADSRRDQRRCVVGPITHHEHVFPRFHELAND